MTIPQWTRAILAATVVAIAIVASPAATAADTPDSGFLPDYSKLQPAKGLNGAPIERWVSPKFSREYYHAVIVDEIEFYPEPQPSLQVSQETLDKVGAYLTTALSDVALAAVPHATEPGPGVIRLRTAITAVSTSPTGLKPYELVPAAFVFSSAMRAAGKRSQNVKLAVEAIASDSVTGEPLAMVVREGVGAKVDNTTTPVTADMLKKTIDQWAAEAAKLVDERLAQPAH